MEPEERFSAIFLLNTLAGAVDVTEGSAVPCKGYPAASAAIVREDDAVNFIMGEVFDGHVVPGGLTGPDSLAGRLCVHQAGAIDGTDWFSRRSGPADAER